MTSGVGFEGRFNEAPRKAGDNADSAMTSAGTLPAWGKYDRSEGNETFHRLEHHCADVAACFETLIADRVLATRFARAAGCADIRLDPVTASRLAVVAFFHDFGKLNAGFQFKVRGHLDLPPNRPPRMGHVTEAFFCIDQPKMLEQLGLSELFGHWGEGFDALLLGALSHHGRPPRPPHSGSGPTEIWESFAGYSPVNAAALLRERAETWFPRAFESGPKLPTAPALAHLFAGTVALADQIGSDRERHFPFEPKADPHYIERARRQARSAIRSRGLQRQDWCAQAGALDFRAMFGHVRPRPLQEAVLQAPLDTPLLILESETGSGKTEAAVLRFAALLRAGLVDGMYFAVPTRAAARQLHARVAAAVKHLLPGTRGGGTVLAIPGYCVMGEANGVPIGGFQVRWEDNPDEADRVARWAAESARHFLGAAAAVGTVDQALLGGLQVKWAHLRGASLARSLLIVDEVHASDAYMTEVLSTLLHGHLAIGGHALLMSATLGATARLAYTQPGRSDEKTDPNDAAQQPYPALTLAGNGRARTQAIARTERTKVVSLESCPWLDDPSRIADEARTAAEDDAKVLVIRNTVATAQAALEELIRAGAGELALAVNGVATLHHSRFAVEDRKLLDDAVEAALGKVATVSGRVVIGTQTLEQSLDIDADLLITDLCPIDVLLQRIGRLHRHRRERPPSHREARCLVLVPEAGLTGALNGGLMRHGFGARPGSSGGIYRNVLGLEATRRLVVEHAVWRIPEMNRRLVEAGTHPCMLDDLAEELGGEWQDHGGRTFGVLAAEEQQARGHALDRRQPFDDEFQFPQLDEQVRTRLGEDGPRFELVSDAPGPFGTPVRTFNLPAHLFGGSENLPTNQELEGAQLVPDTEGGVLEVGVHAFRYDFAGIRREAATR